MVAAVLLDAGGVLVMPDHEIIGAVADAHGGAPSPAALDRGHYEGVAAAEVSVDFDWGAYRRAVLRAAGVPPDRLDAAQQALGRELAGLARSVWTRVLPGAREGVARLVAAGLPLAVVSNSDGTIGEMMRRLGIDVVFDSGVVGVAKPDPAIFQLALDRLGVEAADALYVGDVPSVDVVGARNAGVQPLHLDPIGWCLDGTHPHVRSLPEVADSFI